MAALSTTLLLAGSALSAGASFAQGRGMRRAANFATAQAEAQANDVLARSEEDVTRYRQDLSQLLGTQRARLAASNVDVNQGSAAQLRDQTEAFGEQDMSTIRRNALREAYAIRASGQMQATGLRNQAAGAFAQGAGTLLTTAVDGWQSWRRRTAGVRAGALAARDMVTSGYNF